MKKILSILVLLTFSFTSIGTGWAPETASVKFFIKNAGVEVEGTLSGLSASVEFDPDDLSNSKISAAVQVNTISTGIAMRDNHLRSKDYFHEKMYPEIRMTSTKFSKSGSSYIGYFNLEMHGVTKSVSVPFTFTEKDDKGIFKGEFELDRLDYKVGESSWVLSDDVRVKIVLNTSKKQS